MHSRFLLLCLLLAAMLAAPAVSPAAVVFSSRDKGKVVGPDGEEMNGTAQQLFDTAQAAENSGNTSRAIKAYRAIVKKYPRDTLAAGAAWRYAQLQEKGGDLYRAATGYRVMCEQYPKSPHFDEAIEAQFRIGEQFLNGKKIKVLGIPIRGTTDKAIEVFAGVVRLAPYGKYAPRAQFNIARANEKTGNAEAAVAAYQAVVEKYPDDPLAADAQYQIGYLWQRTTKSGVKDAKAATNAKNGYQDFLYRFPKSEKAAQAKQNLRELEHRQTTDAFKVAKFYDKQKNYRAAVIYYNDVIRQQPGSAEANHAQQRVAQLRAKLGDKALQSAELTAQTAKKPAGHQTASAAARSGGSSSEGSSMMRTSPSDVAPLPPPEADESLPPPASLSPDTTTAPDYPSASASPTPGSPE